MKRIWTINRSVMDEIYTERYRHERAYSKLGDALDWIRVWSNMKTNEGYDIEIQPADQANMHEMTFMAVNSVTKDVETVVLEKIDLDDLKDKDES